MILNIRIETDNVQNNATVPYILTAISKELSRQCRGEVKVSHEVVWEHTTTTVKHAWTQNGQAWECDAYDHGPFCRQCRLVG